MNLGLTESQELLRNSARAFLTVSSPPKAVKALMYDELGYDPSVWQQMVDLGWTGLIIPETYGGTGGSVLDGCILFEEIGRTLAPSPLFTSSVLAASLIMHAGSDAQKNELLPDIAEGRRIVAVAVTDRTGTWDPSGIDTSATRTGDGFVLNGVKMFVDNANVADVLIVVAREGDGAGAAGLGAFLADPKQAGVSLVRLQTIAGDPQFEVTLNDVPATPLGDPASDWAALEAGFAPATVIKTAEMVASSQRALEMTVDYAKIRVQFGRPIGSFQAIQHKCAGMATQVDGARLLAYEAAWKLDEGLPAEIEVSLAKEYANEVFRNTTVEAHLVFAGLAYTMEHDLHLYFRRVLAADAMLGDSEYHQDKLAAALNL